MWCYCKILHISHKDHVTNADFRVKIQQAIGSHEDRLTIVKRHKLQRYGHVSRLSGPAKTMLQGTVKGGRRQVRQRKRWKDNIREWTDLDFGRSQRALENGENWRKLVAESSVVPQRPSRLRYRWWRWWWCTCGWVYIPCIYLHARWSYRRRFRALLLCPLSVERYYFPLLILQRYIHPVPLPCYTFCSF